MASNRQQDSRDNVVCDAAEQQPVDASSRLGRKNDAVRIEASLLPRFIFLLTAVFDYQVITISRPSLSRRIAASLAFDTESGSFAS